MSPPQDWPRNTPRRLSVFARYALAVAAVVVALFLRRGFDPVWGLKLPFILFYPAIVVSAWLGGLWPGIVTTLLSAAAAEYFWLEPVRSWKLADPADALGLLVFLLIGGVISVINEAWRRQTMRVLDLDRELGALLERERQARSDAERANRTKDEFLAVLSHELRTPIQAVMSYAHLLRSQTMPVERFIQAVEAIQRSAQAQARLVDSLLDLSRIEAGKLELHLADVELSSVVSAAVDALRPAADGKNLALEVTAPPSPIVVVGDGGRLEQVVWNLLSNAVKFTPSGGRVEVRIEQWDGKAEVRVIDTGQGISAELLPHVFERFAQAESARKRVDGGLGLGLTIVRELVKAHGGTVVAQSSGEEKGSTFTLTLPVRPEIMPPREALGIGFTGHG